jgi:hypothetical protein
VRKALLALSVLALLMTVVSTATAQNQITLGGTAANSLTFTGEGSGNWTLTFAGGTLTGTAFGTGTLNSGPDPYTISQSGVTITGTYLGSDTWSIAQSGSLAFCYGGCGASALLTGNLQLINLAQTDSTGTFNDSLSANLTSLGGSLASLLGSGGVLSITIDFSTPTNLASLTPGATLGANVSSGELFPSPEPASMVLVGSGLMLLGGFVQRRRRTAQRS